MGKAAAKSHPDTREHEREALEKLLASLASNAHAGASHMVVGTAAAHHWTDLERAIARLMQGAAFPTPAVTAETLRLLGRTDRSGKRREAYHGLASELQHRADTGLLTIPAEHVARHIHHAVLWYAAWHLLAAGLPMPRVIRALQTDARTARPAQTKTASRIHIPWKESVRVGRRTWQSFAKGSTWLAVQAVTQTKRGAAALRQARAERAAQAAAQEAALRKQVEMDKAAAQAKKAAATTRAPPSTEPDRTPTLSQSMPLNGRALKGSVVGTWLMLVVFSWVSLFWGALISMPMGIGIGIAATATVGIIVVPLWGTIWGFFGMDMASESTLKQLQFTKAAPDSTIGKVSHTFADALGIPPPQVGTIPACNAFAVGVNEQDATVAIGEPLLARLTPAETAAVIGHELGHIVSGDMRRMMLMRTFQNATVWFGLAQGVKLFARWVICWVAELAILAFSRRREYWADAIGAALAGKEAMIGALSKLEDAPALSDAENTHARFMFRGRTSLFSTHPSTYERIRALQDETYIRRLPLRRSDS